jgi:hypothetical protein
MNETTHDRIESAGNVLSIIFMIALAAFFLYGYLPRFFG